MLQEFSDDHWQPRDAHVDRERSGECRERLPVQPVAGLVRLFVTRDERDCTGVVAVRERDFEVRPHRQRCRYTGNNLVGDARVPQCLGFLTTAAEDQRIAAFEPHDRLPSLRGLDEHLVDVRVPVRMQARQIADADLPGRRRSEFEQPFGNELVVKNEVRAGQHFGRPEREKPRVAGSGTNEKHVRV